ncbi:MAG: Crp/Fnr family transcriptional regulator [Gammaproteobacteria bacterium]|nr:Crp/Fnr family transcriptional regulator [Gammaproteobacteria bacterium]
MAGIELFRELPAEQRKEIVKSCHAHQCAAKQQIVSHADQSTDVYFIVSGQVRATICSASGREVTFRDLGPGEMFGDLSAIDGKPRSATVVAIVDSLVLSMSAGAYLNALRSHPEICMGALRELAGLVRLLTDRIVEMSTLGVKNRIHAELLRLAQKGKKEDNAIVISPIPTHANIASRVSTHREAVTRELNELAHIGLVERRSGALVIKNVARLQRMVEEVRSHQIS